MIQLASLQKYFSNEKNNSKVNYIKLPSEKNSKKSKKVHPETVLDKTHSDTSHFNGNRKKCLPEVKTEIKSNERFDEIPQCATGLELIKLYKVWSFQGKNQFQTVRFRIPTVKLKIPVKLFFKSESRTSVTFKL